MIYRNFWQVSTGKWLNVLLTQEGDDFFIPAKTHRDQIADGWGLPADDVDVLDSESDARTGILLEGPVPPPLPPDADEELAKAIEAATTLAALKTALVGKAAKVKARV